MQGRFDRGWAVTCGAVTMLLLAQAAMGQTASAPSTEPSEPTTMPASTEPGTGPATEPSLPPPQRAIDLLDVLEARDKTLNDFQAKVNYKVEQSRTMDEQVETGTMAYVKEAGVTKIAVHFVRSSTGDAFFKEDRDLIFDGLSLVDRRNDKKQFTLHEQRKAGDAINPLKLGEGPLPLPIGQSRTKILAQFTVSLGEETTGPAHLVLVPHHPEAFDFTRLDLWIDEGLALPITMKTVGTGGNITTVRLTEVKVNQGTAAIFDVTVPAAGSGWDVRVKKIGE